MTKTTTFLSALLCSTVIGFTQDYTVEYSESDYEPLVDANLLNENDPEIDGFGNELYGSIPIGFEFNYHDFSFNSLRVGGNGYVTFSSGGEVKSFINIFECRQTNFQGESELSPIYYEVSGEPGSKIFKLEYVKSGFVNDEEEEDFINYQLWIYEDCNVFEFHFGEVSIDAAETDLFYNSTAAPFIGFGSNDPSFFRLLAGDITTPIIQGDPLNSLVEVPGTGVVYTFRNCFVNLEKEVSNAFRMYPNPSSDVVTIELSEVTEAAELRISNLSGQTVFTEILPATNSYSLNIDFLPQGIYVAEIESENAIYSTKLVKE